MSLSHATALAADIVREFESLRLEVYRCPAGHPTIGYGHRVGSMAHPPITEAQAEDFLGADLRVAMDAVLEDAPHLMAEPPGRLAALGSFTFNVGVGSVEQDTGWRGSVLRLRVMAQRWDAAAAQFRRWVWAVNPKTGKKRVLAGLVRRRERERAVFLQPEVA